MQCGTQSASMDTQRELQSAAHTFYQQVVCILRQRVLLEKDHPGLFIAVFNTLEFSLNYPEPLPIDDFFLQFFCRSFNFNVSLYHPGSCQHLLLATMFALNFCYQPVDLVLVIKSGILEILSMLTNNSCALINQGWFAASTSGSMLLSAAVRLACARLLQILTVAAR